jgi:hypothetical protein
VRERIAREPEPASKERPSAATPAAASTIVDLQRTAGNAAVTALLARAPTATATETPTDRLRRLLRDKDEAAAIAQFGALSATEAGSVLADRSLRDLAVKAFDDDQMARAMRAIVPGVRLAQKLNWTWTEDTNWKAVKALISDPKVPAAEKAELYDMGWPKDLFVDVCGNDEMAEAVLILGGRLDQQLRWMIAEGTDAQLVYRLAWATPAANLLTGGLPRDIQVGLRKELGGKEYQRAVQMLTDGLLTWEEIDSSRTEEHYELKDASDPTKGYELVDFKVESKYEINYTRTALHVKVRIKLTGEQATAAHRAIWENGIAAKWNNAFHVENGRRLPIVFEPVWVPNNAHHEIKLHKPPVVREDAANWYAGPNANPGPGAAQDTTDANTAAHEFGHLIGLADEYNLTAADYQKMTGSAPPPGPMPAGGYDTTSVMAVITGPVEGRHMRPFVNWLNRHRLPGERPYRVVAGP